MSLPEPKTDEKEEEFVERCMRNSDMKTDFADNDERHAGCVKRFKEKNDKHKPSEDKPKKKKDKKSMPEEKKEYRSFDVEEIRLQLREDDIPTIVGHAAVFNSLSEEMFGFREKIAPGAFRSAINQNQDVRALINHDSNFVLGRTKNGTLSLSEDTKGLRVEINPPTTTFAADLLVSIERRDINQMSFGFQVLAESWELNGDENIRTIEDVNLFDVSVVTFPAYPTTDVEVNLRSWDEAGLDYEKLSRVMVRVSHGLPLTDEDREILRSSTIRLNDIAEPKGSLESDEPTPRSRYLRRKQRQLVL